MQLKAQVEYFGRALVEKGATNPDLVVLDVLEVSDHTKGRPHVIVAKTTKGKGVSFMEGNRFSRSVPNASQLQQALEELERD